MTADRPRRRLRLELDMGADSLDELCGALTSLAHDLHSDGEHERRTVVVGGYASGYVMTLTCDPEMTGDRFRAENHAYVQQKKDDR